MLSTYDVAIIGAGPAGAAVASRLARAGRTVVLLDRSRLDAPRVGESLAPGVQPLLRDLGVWDAFLDLGPLPSYGTRSVWGSARSEEHAHIVTPFLNGWHVDRLAFDRMLVATAEQAGVHLELGARIIRCNQASQHGVSVQVKTAANPRAPAELNARFLIDASGRQAVSTRWFGAHRVTFDQLVAVAAYCSDVRAEQHCYTLVESTPDGWWYAAPVVPGRSVAMWMTDRDLAHAAQAGALPQWQRALQHAVVTSARLQDTTVIWGPKIVSAMSQRVLRKQSDITPWLAVGDAALAVDPISGSGVVRALRTAQEAARTVSAVLGGDNSAILRYEAERNAECTTYLSERAAYYGLERRWPQDLFWSRRGAILRPMAVE
jgi:2-polyprenyl-6-methoxyphenol hydroxylase-like FAD-dependent oxidoreductase